MIIVGAGLSGLIAASMLRDEVTAIYEIQESLPNNHSALLRFKSSVVGDATGVPFKKVNVMKCVYSWRNPVADAMSYSKKVTGSYTLRSSVKANGEIEERYIAPEDFIQRLGNQVNHKIRFNKTLEDAVQDGKKMGVPVISTVPMPVLIDNNLDLRIKIKEKGVGGEFKSRPASILNYKLRNFFDICATVYLPDPDCDIYRASITENNLILEGFRTQLRQAEDGSTISVFGSESIRKAFKGLGVDDGDLFYNPSNPLPIIGLDTEKSIIEWQQGKIKDMHYAKILPIDEAFRKTVIMEATELGVYSLGRFATWRPKLLLDDIVNDVRVIQRMINGSKDKKYNTIKG